MKWLIRKETPASFALMCPLGVPGGYSGGKGGLGVRAWWGMNVSIVEGGWPVAYGF